MIGTIWITISVICTITSYLYVRNSNSITKGEDFTALFVASMVWPVALLVVLYVGVHYVVQLPAKLLFKDED